MIVIEMKCCPAGALLIILKDVDRCRKTSNGAVQRQGKETKMVKYLKEDNSRLMLALTPWQTRWPASSRLYI